MKDYFITRDMPLACTLITLGFRLEVIDRSEGERYQFCFGRQERLDQTVQAFWKGELAVEPKSLFVHHKLLKSQLYN